MTDIKAPNLFLVGAMKSGTSTLHKLLGTHPEVFMSTPKEPTYFVPNNILRSLWPEMAKMEFSQTKEAYLALFKEHRHAKYCGESSTNYSKEPLITGVARRIHSFNSDARIIYLLRDPVERTISHYWHSVKREHETREIIRAIEDTRHFTDVSHYAMQLERYLDLFPEDYIKVITLEEFVRSPLAVLQSLFRWLGIAPDFTPDNLNKREHVTKDVVYQTRSPRLFRTSIFLYLKSALRSTLPGRIRRIGKAIYSHPIHRESVDLIPVARHLREIQVPQTNRLSLITGRSFSEWTTLWDTAD